MRICHINRVRCECTLRIVLLVCLFHISCPNVFIWSCQSSKFGFLSYLVNKYTFCSRVQSFAFWFSITIVFEHFISKTNSRHISIKIILFKSVYFYLFSLISSDVAAPTGNIPVRHLSFLRSHEILLQFNLPIYFFFPFGQRSFFKSISSKYSEKNCILIESLNKIV